MRSADAGIGKGGSGLEADDRYYTHSVVTPLPPGEIKGLEEG